MRWSSSSNTCVAILWISVILWRHDFEPPFKPLHIRHGLPRRAYAMTRWELRCGSPAVKPFPRKHVFNAPSILNYRRFSLKLNMVGASTKTSESNPELIVEIRRLETHLQQNDAEYDEALHQLMSLSVEHIHNFPVFLAAVQTVRRALLAKAKEFRIRCTRTEEFQFAEEEMAKTELSSPDARAKQHLCRFIAFLLKSLHDEDPRVQIVSLDSLMDIVLIECKSLERECAPKLLRLLFMNLCYVSSGRSLQTDESSGHCFSNTTFFNVLRLLLTAHEDSDAVIRHFLARYCIPYDDIQFYTLNSLR